MTFFVPGILRISDFERGMRSVISPDIERLTYNTGKEQKRKCTTSSCPDHLERTRVLLLRSKERVGARDTSHEISLADSDSITHKVEDVRAQRLSPAKQATQTTSTPVLINPPEATLSVPATSVDFFVSPSTRQAGTGGTDTHSSGISAKGTLELVVRVPSALSNPSLASSDPPIVEELQVQARVYASRRERENRDELFFRPDEVALRKTAKDIRPQQGFAIPARLSSASNTEDLTEIAARSRGQIGQEAHEVAQAVPVETSLLVPAGLALPVITSSAITEADVTCVVLPASPIVSTIAVHAATILPRPYPIASAFRPRNIVIRGSDTALGRIASLNAGHFQKRLMVCDLLGSGAYGAVYHVKYPVTHSLGVSGAFVIRVRSVALKVFFDLDKASRRAIEYETDLLRRISHPSILRVHSSCSNCGYMLMEMPSNINLGDATMQRLIPREGLKSIAAQLVFILEYLRLKRVAHWDFRACNIAVNVEQAGYPVTLLDFGLSEEVPLEREYHLPRGPVCCRPPEMYGYALDGISGYDAFSAHWYALGVLLYRLAYRAYPFVNDTFTEAEARWRAENTPLLMRKGIAEEDIDQYILGISHTPRAPSPAHADPDLDDLIRQLMNPDPKKRADFVKTRQHRWLSGVNWKGLERAFTEVAAAHSADSVH